MTLQSTRFALLIGALAAIAASCAHAQQEPQPESTPAIVDLGPQADAERSVRKIYATFFKRARDEISRRTGFERLAEHMHDDRVFPLMLELFEDESLEIRNELLELFVSDAGGYAQPMLAWVAVFDEDEQHRAYASSRLADVVGDGEPTIGAQRVIALGIKSKSEREINAAASLVRTFNLLRAVPLLAQAQVQRRSSGGNETRSGAIAQIVVGTQQAFVADLTPVVATGAVGFQPTIGVVSSGVVLRVIDAVVYEYRTEVHRVLVEMTSAATGQPTGRMGYDANAWRTWYAEELEPMLDARG